MTAKLRSRLFAAALVLPALSIAAFATDRTRESVELVSQGVTVTMDQARIMRLPGRVATIVIGNPLIADATVQAGGLMVLTGKAIGSTNLIALDARGEQLMSMQIRVRPQTDSVVQVYRGTDRETYSCSPICERSMAVGDSKEFFDTALGQVRSRDGAASARGTANAPR
ncbi:pilus assembly protein N-terminal domain-containing protein [Phreatobacter sp.]|uniref:pilus assembly protein N-terminal domain-containing protein n=1 Tax=Phreatobacter sp. TaxID=1966341 RepID=UPI003F717530